MLFYENNKSSAKRHGFYVDYYIIFFTVLLLAATTSAGYIINVDAVRTGSFEPVDSLYANVDYEFRIWIETDQCLGSMILTWQVYSPDALTWEWRSMPDGFGTSGFVTNVPGAKYYPVESIFDMTGWLMTEFDTDGISPDSFTMGGVSMFDCWPFGFTPLEHFLSMHFTVGPLDVGEVRTLCIDSIMTGPGGANFEYRDWTGDVYPWTFNGPFCWPVTRCCIMGGDPNGDGGGGVGDAVYLISYIFKGGPDPICFEEGDANSDGTVNVGDVVYIIVHVFKGGPRPECP